MYQARQTFEVRWNSEISLTFGLYVIQLTPKYSPFEGRKATGRRLPVIAEALNRAMWNLQCHVEVLDGDLCFFPDPDDTEYIRVKAPETLEEALLRRRKIIDLPVVSDQSDELWALSNAQALFEREDWKGLDELCIRLVARDSLLTCQRIKKCYDSRRGDSHFEPMEQVRFLVKHKEEARQVWNRPDLYVRWHGLWVEVCHLSGIWKSKDRPINPEVYWRFETAEARWRTFSPGIKKKILDNLKFLI